MTQWTARLRGAFRSSALRAVAMLSGGQSVAILIPILAAPILGRLYAPADYGALALYMAPAAILAVVATLQFQHAIITEGSDRTAWKVAWLCMLTALVFSSAVTFGVAALWKPILAESAAGAWFIFLPASVAGAGVVAAGGVLANRYRRYRWLASLQVVHVCLTVALSIAFGMLRWGADGLLSAYFIGQAVQVGATLWLLRQVNGKLGLPSIPHLRVLMRRHWKFPAFTMPGEFLGQINMQAPVFALSALGADATLGAFTRARQLVGMPVTILGNAVAQVFRREASESYRTIGSCRSLMLRTAGGLFAAGLGPCLLFIGFAPWLFTAYLGPSWTEAGEIARILAPMLLLRVAISPITPVFYFTGHQSLDLKLMIASVATMTVVLILGSVIGDDEMNVIWAFAIGYGAIYMVYFFAALRVAKA